MLVWLEGIDNGCQKIRNYGYDVIVGGELFIDYFDYFCKFVMLNLKFKLIGVGCYQFFFCWWDVYCKQFGLKDFFLKSQDVVVLQQIKECGVLFMIDCGDICQVIDCCSNIWVLLLGVGYGQFEYKVDSLIVKFKEVGGMVREIDV